MPGGGSKIAAMSTAGPAGRLRTSLQRLSRTLDIEVESAREGIASLLKVGDFTASIDIEPAAEHQMFELRVDRDRFYRSGSTVRRGFASADPAMRREACADLAGLSSLRRDSPSSSRQLPLPCSAIGRTTVELRNAIRSVEC
jgi:hypothetical protein